MAKNKQAKKHAKPARKPARAKAKEKRVTIEGLEKSANELMQQIAEARAQIMQNEQQVKRKVNERIKLEDALALLLKQGFAEETAVLLRVKQNAEKTEAELLKKISSLERITRIYDEKKQKISETKKRQAALKKQLDLLKKKKEELGIYA